MEIIAQFSFPRLPENFFYMLHFTSSTWNLLKFLKPLETASILWIPKSATPTSSYSQSQEEDPKYRGI